MFERLFEDHRALARHCHSQLAEERRRYLSHCAGLGHAQRTLRTIAAYLLVITDYLRLGDRPNDLIALAEIQAQADCWANRPNRPAHRTPTGRARHHFILYATHWLQFLGRWQAPVVASPPCADLVAAFADHMHRERGLSPTTITFRCQFVQESLTRLCASRCLQEVTPVHVDEALAEKLNQGCCARATVRTYASALRAFFRYAEAAGWCRRGLAESVRGPRVYAQETLPSGPSWDDVCRLLATTEGDKPRDIRDRAILLLLSTYGCRASEVVRLRLENLDWQQELIHFTRPKLSRTQTYPLSQPVGDAILRYLKEVRPNSSYREVFLRMEAPLRPLTRIALHQVVSPRLHSLGITLRHYGAHALRHACATHLLEQGFTLKQIGDHLGHRSPETTRIYTKVDLGRLRQVADFDIGDLL